MGQPDIYIVVIIVYGAIISPSIPRVYNGVWPPIYLSLMRLKHVSCWLQVTSGLLGFSFAALCVSMCRSGVSRRSCELNFEPILVPTSRSISIWLYLLCRHGIFISYILS